MNPLDRKEKEKLNSPPMEEDKPEPQAQSRGDTSSTASSSKILSLDTLLMIAASCGKEGVPEFIRTQISQHEEMNPLDGKEREKPYSSPMEEDQPERASADQETEQPPNQSGGDTSSSAFSSRIRRLQRLHSRRLHRSKRQKLQNSTESGDPKPDPSDSDADSDDGNHFDVLVTNSNCLPISIRVAGDHFPFFSTLSNGEQILQLTDPCDHKHHLTFLWFKNEDSFILTQNWPQYAKKFNLRLMDRVRFTWPQLTIQKPTPLNRHPRRILHFLTQHFPRPEGEPLQINPPKFLPEKFLFELELTSSDARMGRLAISQEQVQTHFGGLDYLERGKYEMVKFTDCNEKHWFLKIVYSDSSLQFMVINGWEKLAKEHKLAPADFMRFYGIDTHQMHFLIQFVKGRQGSGESSGEARGGADVGERSGGTKDKVEGVSQEP